MRQGLQILGSYPQKNTTWKFMQIMWNVNWHLVGLLFWREATLSYFYGMIRFGYLERDYSLSKGDMTLELTNKEA